MLFFVKSIWLFSVQADSAFLVSSSIAQLLCQNRKAQKAKCALGAFLYLTPGANRAILLF
ncbi:hypothetical protein GS18_0206595 [Metabacillus indicus]|uniref:Uncharacterized protein n=1 Tax=Metabacillus indicus TaxID=246786 RepID=A0A084H106_METID|nr:hypothetical protein GS18_0206595 [Metabacillus indicus]